MFGKKSLKVIFGNFSKEQASQLVSNKIELSILLSKNFLEKIPDKMNPTSTKNNRLEFEIMSEGFLFFFIGARDALLQKINEKFTLGLDIDDVELSRILGGLDKNNTTQETVHQLLNDATQLPRHTVNGWERNHTWLWEINHLRNRIAHQSIISSAVSVVVGSSSDPKADMIIYTQGERFQHDPVKESKPKDYFKDCMKKFEKLKTDVEKLM